VPVVVEVPVRVGGEPVVAIAVEDDRVIAGYTVRTEQLREGVRLEDGGLVDLDDPDPGIVRSQ
jgi:hypothetical protein